MTNRKFRKKPEEDGTPKKLARMLSEVAEEIFALDEIFELLKKAEKQEKAGNHEAAADPFLERITEEYGVPDDPLANMIEDPDGIARRREILADAAVCACTDRNMLYGEPEDSFGMIARLWEGYLGIPVTENDVVDLMILMKVARNGTAKVRCRDTYVDIAGYAACGGGGIEV